MKLAIAGVSHKTAPVAIRESLAFRDESVPGALERLR
jgi:glutamyl-tRNA reductase